MSASSATKGDELGADMLLLSARPPATCPWQCRPTPRRRPDDAAAARTLCQSFSKYKRDDLVLPFTMYLLPTQQTTASNADLFSAPSNSGYYPVGLTSRSLHNLAGFLSSTKTKGVFKVVGYLSACKYTEVSEGRRGQHGRSGDEVIQPATASRPHPKDLE